MSRNTAPRTSRAPRWNIVKTSRRWCLGFNWISTKISRKRRISEAENWQRGETSSYPPCTSNRSAVRCFVTSANYVGLHERMYSTSVSTMFDVYKQNIDHLHIHRLFGPTRFCGGTSVVKTPSHEMRRGLWAMTIMSVRLSVCLSVASGTNVRFVQKLPNQSTWNLGRRWNHDSRLSDAVLWRHHNPRWRADAMLQNIGFGYNSIADDCTIFAKFCKQMQNPRITTVERETFQNLTSAPITW